jgi:hypothetical protein
MPDSPSSAFGPVPDHRYRPPPEFLGRYRDKDERIAQIRLDGDALSVQGADARTRRRRLRGDRLPVQASRPRAA